MLHDRPSSAVISEHWTVSYVQRYAIVLGCSESAASSGDERPAVLLRVSVCAVTTWAL